MGKVQVENMIKALPVKFYRLSLLLLMTGLVACAGNDKVEATPENMTELLRQEILSTVKDVERANQAADFAEQLKQVFVAAHEQSKKDVDTYRSLNANFDSTDEDFKKFFDGINARGKERQEKVVTINGKMKSVLTAEEWQLLEDARKKALKIDLKLL